MNLNFFRMRIIVSIVEVWQLFDISKSNFKQRSPKRAWFKDEVTHNAFKNNGINGKIYSSFVRKTKKINAHLNPVQDQMPSTKL